MDENISQIVSSCNSFQKVCKWQRLLVTPFKGDNLYEVGNMVFKQYYVRINAAWEAKTKWLVWLHAEQEDMGSIPVISECISRQV